MTTATVESLTAEVRVLMVGNRQVTLSVYKQLDEFPSMERSLNGFQPFGRVRSGAKYPDVDRRKRVVTREALWEFVGKDEQTGNLVRLVVMPGDKELYNESDGEWELVCGWSDLPLIVLAGLR